jgi:large subunit ribosomal protein L3
MSGFILAEKTKQTQMFDTKGNRIPVTHLVTESCYLVDVKWNDVDGYCAVKLGFGQKKSIGKSIKGQFTKAGIENPLRFLKEIRVRPHQDVKPFEEEGKKGFISGEGKVFIGEQVDPSIIFKVGDIVNVSGTSKGKGFQGVVKRHGFRGGPRTHGQSDRERAPGSMGQTTTPGHTYKGKRMAGRMGGDRITVSGLEVMSITNNEMIVKGLVPGNVGGLLEVKTKN